MPDVRRRAHAVLLPSADIASRRLGALLCLPACTAAEGQSDQQVHNNMLAVASCAACLIGVRAATSSTSEVLSDICLVCTLCCACHFLPGSVPCSRQPDTLPAIALVVLARSAGWAMEGIPQRKGPGLHEVSQAAGGQMVWQACHQAATAPAWLAWRTTGVPSTMAEDVRLLSRSSAGGAATS